MFDWICERLHCPRCGEVAADPCAIDLQTKLHARPALASYAVGDAFDVRPETAAGGYLVLRPARSPICALEAWSCPHCGATFLWARVTIADGVVTSVTNAALDLETLADVDLVTGEVLQLLRADEIIAAPRWDSETLRARLAAAERERLTSSPSRP